MAIHGRHVRDGAHVIVNGRRAVGEVRTDRGDEIIEIELAELPPAGIHFLQVQNPDSLFSNDFIFHVADDEEDARRVRLTAGEDAIRQGLAGAIASGELEQVKKLVASGAPVDGRDRGSGMPPLCTAAFHGRTRIAQFLLDGGADPSGENRDGNTPLHIAAFLCRGDIVDLLVRHGASLKVSNGRGETPVDVVAGEWNPGLEGFYRALSDGNRLGLEIGTLEKRRAEMVARLRGWLSSEAP
jgi:hypothetical protein